MIRERIREVYAEQKLNDPAEITAEVLTRLTDDERAQALTEMLPAYVREVQHGFRRRHPVHRQVFHGQVQASWKQVGIRSLYEQLMAENYPTPNGWRRMAQLTLSDLGHVQQKLRAQARHLNERAEGFDALADLMREHNAIRVAEIPREAILAWNTTRAVAA